MLEKILDCLNARAARATYKAVGDVIGVYHRNVRLELGHRCPRNCWIVNRSARDSPAATPRARWTARFDRHSRLLTTGRELGQFVDDRENDRLSRLH